MMRTVSCFGRGLIVGLLLMGLAGVPACGSSRAAPLQRSTTVSGQLSQVSDQHVETAIGIALARRHWRVLDKVPGRYTAELAEREFRVRIQVVYGPPGIVVNYVESDGLHYEKDGSGGETIHRKYDGWIRNLAVAIQSAMATGQTAPAVPAPPVPASAVTTAQ